MESQPKVSIIINCYNGEEFLEETFHSIKNQTYQNYEIIFYDNNSDDKTATIANAFGEKLKYFKSNTLLPLGKARNNALKFVLGEYIAFIDADDLWDSDKLEKQVDILERNKDVCLVMSNFRTLDMLKNRLIIPKAQKNKKYQFDEFVLNYAFCLSTFMIRKQCVDKLSKWFDEKLQYAEEYDFFSRMMYMHEAYYIGMPLATRRMHKSMNSIKLSTSIPMEHQMTMDNLREYIPSFDTKYPLLKKRISYLRDYMDAKIHFTEYGNKTIRSMMKPYIFKEKRALAYYMIAVLPQKLSSKIIKIIYKNHI